LSLWRPNDRDRQIEKDVIERMYQRGRRWFAWAMSLVWGGFMFIWMTALDFIRRPHQQFKGFPEVLWLLLSLSL
jgi:hypothetical protein